MNPRLKQTLICLTLITLTCTAFWQIGDLGFVNYDDNLYVTDNPHVKTGLSLKGMVWAFTSAHAANWHPLTWLSHMADCEFYGLNPKGHHLTSQFLHLLNTVLLFLLLNSVTGAVWKSGLVAALFAVHPLHVESVAWVSERKDVLSTFFWLLGLMSYIRYVKTPNARRYLLLLLIFACGLMAKPMLVTLPFVLLLVDYWPLCRMQFQPGSPSCIPFVGTTRLSSLGALKEKAPLFALSLVSSAVTILVQQHGQAVTSLQLIPFHLRVANALLSYVRYIGKAVWPCDLAVFYPFSLSMSAWQVVGSGLLLLGISALAFRSARRYPYFVVGWLWYIGALLPVIGIVQVGTQAMADRYAYIPHIGLFWAVVWIAADTLERVPKLRVIGPVLAGVIVCALTACTWKQLEYWRSSTDLWTHALTVVPDNYIARNNLGIALERERIFGQARGHFLSASRQKPDLPDAYYNLGHLELGINRFEDAARWFTKALRIKPDYAEAHNNLGVALERQGDLNGAQRHFFEALKLKPDYAEAHYNVGVILQYQNRAKDAIPLFARAIAIRPDYPDAHNNLGVALVTTGRPNEGVLHFQEALRLNPQLRDAQQNLEFLGISERKGQKQ
ncbi:MAG: tetratricopeptide repeat protein [Pseudomonadota bacterium]